MLFTHPEHLSKLKASIVLDGKLGHGVCVEPTGQCQNAWLKAGISSLSKAVDENKQKQNLREVLDERNIAGGCAITEDMMRSIITNAFDQRLPEDFQLQSVTILTAMSLWYRGNPSKNYPPFRELFPRDFNVKRSRKYFSEWGKVLEAMETASILSIDLIN